jgi:hypothetical protein
VYGNWPGLSQSQLYQSRDLAVTTDFRDVIATVLGRSGGDKRPKTKTNNGIERFSPRGKNPELIDNILF